jgi:hypothetical protein
MRSPVVLVVAAAALSACAPTALGAPAPTSTPSAPMTSPAAASETVPADAPPSPASPTPSLPAASASLPPSPTPVATPTATDPLSTPSAPKPAPVGALVLGDSISLSVAPLLSPLGYPVIGRVGQSANDAFLRQHLGSSQAQAAPAWVIVLGTNNRGDEGDVARLATWVDALADLRTPGAKQRVYWVTPHRPDAYTGGMSRWTLDAFNAELVRLADEHRWFRVIDFDTLASQHPEWFAQDGGHLHPDRDGQQALVDLIAGPGAAPAESSAPVTELQWPTPEPTPDPAASEEPMPEDMVFDNDLG